MEREFVIQSLSPGLEFVPNFKLGPGLIAMSPDSNRTMNKRNEPVAIGKHNLLRL